MAVSSIIEITVIIILVKQSKTSLNTKLISAEHVRIATIEIFTYLILPGGGFKRPEDIKTVGYAVNPNDNDLK